MILSEIGDRLGRFICMPFVRLFPVVQKYKAVLLSKDASSLTIDLLMRCEIPEYDRNGLSAIRVFFPPHIRREGGLESLRNELELEEKITSDIHAKIKVSHNG